MILHLTQACLQILLQTGVRRTSVIILQRGDERLTLLVELLEFDLMALNEMVGIELLKIYL